MLKITVELIPHGIESNKKVISELFISNTGEKDELEEYTYRYTGWVEHEPSNDENLNKLFGKHEFKGTVKNDRRNMLYLLLYKVIHNILANPLTKPK